MSLFVYAHLRFFSMNRDEAIKLLRGGPKGVSRWNQKVKDGLAVDLSGVNLSGADLSGAFLHRVNLANANLKGAILYETVLANAGLHRVNLEDAKLSKAHIYYGWDFFQSASDMPSAWIKPADLTNADLSQAIMNETHLFGVDLSGASLQEASLLGAVLSKAILLGADLTDADLSDASCDFTNFDFADLTRANLSNTYLVYASFRGSILQETKFKEACFGGTVLNCDMSTTIGLNSAVHEGGSVVDSKTLESLTWPLPEKFLKGCGFSQEDIALYRRRKAPFYGCFISYSSRDESFVKRLHADLHNIGVQCWFAPKDMKIGDKIRETIDRAIYLREKLLLILSETSIKSQWVEQEVETAFEKERDENRLLLFPIRIDNAVMEEKAGWVSYLRRTRHIGDFSDWRNRKSYQKALKRLLQDLKVEDKTTKKNSSKFIASRNSSIYHISPDCRYAKVIKDVDRVTGAEAKRNRTRHEGCPR